MVRERKIKKEQPAPKVIEEQKTTWKVMSGGITLKNKEYYEKGQTFEAFDQDVPEAFRDIVVPITPIIKKKEKPAPKYFKREIVPTVDELDDEDYVQLYDIINEVDKVLSEKPLTEEEADAFLNKLNS